MFNLEKLQIRDMDPELLQDWVARLCMAEVARKGGSRQVVRCGSDINAPDGGVDVEVKADNSDHIGDFIPRPWTRIQVKKSRMGKSDIAEEMAPGGRLRESIRDVVCEGGCYMIVSLGSDPAPLEIGPLHEAMIEAIPDIAAAGGTVRFLGISELLQWAVAYRSVRLWLREKLGIGQYGWKSHGNWSINGSNTEDTLITDPGVRISINPRVGQDLGITEGITELRTLAQNSPKPIRILGQSGIGKTRIVQALFECPPGTNALDHTNVFYGDCRIQLQPHPSVLLTHLIAEDTETFLVLDNCPLDLHDAMAQLVRVPGCRVHLITVDLDIRHDKSGHTHVVQVRARDTQATAKLLALRFPHIGDRNAKRIVKFASGNAWVAILLAGNIESGESIAALSDDALLRRIVGADDELVTSAEVLSLVYSFSTETRGSAPELSVLGGLVGLSADQIYSHGQALRERHLIEDRGRWWAVLPEAIANRLASIALSRMSPEAIIDAFRPTTLPRLFLSLAHRLSYLHDSDRAVEFAKSWLSKDGPLSDLSNLDGENAEVICYAAAIIPGPVLRKIEAWLAEAPQEPQAEQTEHTKESDLLVVGSIMNALTVIACEEGMFGRCIDALALLARRQHELLSVAVRALALRLFSFSFRWIRPGIKDRFAIICRYLQSDDPSRQIEGRTMLLSALHLRSPFKYFPNYGARTHNQGGLPESDMSEAEWGTKLLDVISGSVPGLPENARRLAKGAFAGAFSNLWEIPELRDALVKTSKILGAKKPWRGGWMAALETRSLRLASAEAGSKEEEYRRLTRLARVLRPTDPVDLICGRIRSLPFEAFRGDGDRRTLPPDISEENLRASARLAVRIGERAARMESVNLRQFFSGMFRDENEHTYFFARGAIRGHADLKLLWDGLVAELDKASGESPGSPNIFIGIIDEARSRDSNLAQRILDEASEHPKLRKKFAALQQRVETDARAVARLERCLSDQAISTRIFAGIAWQESFLGLSEETLVRLLHLIASREGGARSVTRGLAIRFGRHPSLPVGPAIVDLGLALATQVIEKHTNTWDLPPPLISALCSVIDTCSEQQVSQSGLQPVLEKLILKFPLLSDDDKEEKIFHLLNRLTEKAPHVALDILFVGQEDTDAVNHFLTAWHEREDSAFSLVGAENLESWADGGDRENRLRLIARALWPVNAHGDDGELRLTETARKIVDASKDPERIVLAFAQSLSVPPRHDDSDTVVSHRLAVFHRLADESGVAVRGWSAASASRVEDLAEEYRQKEQNRKLQPFE